VQTAGPPQKPHSAPDERNAQNPLTHRAAKPVEAHIPEPTAAKGSAPGHSLDQRGTVDPTTRLTMNLECHWMHHTHHDHTAVRAVILFFTAKGHPLTRSDMTQAINATPVTARVTLLDAAGLVTTKLPDGTTPVWAVDRPDAFTLAPSADGLSVAVSAPADIGATGTLSFTLGTIVATAAIAHVSAAPAPAPAPAPAEPGVAVSASISFDAVAPAV